MKSYRFYVSDYLRETKHLCIFRDLIYRRLLDWYHLEEMPLPGDLMACVKISGFEVEDEDAVNDVKNVLEEFFFKDSEGRWNHGLANENIKRRNHDAVEDLPTGRRERELLRLGLPLNSKDWDDVDRLLEELESLVEWARHPYNYHIEHFAPRRARLIIARLGKLDKTSTRGHLKAIDATIGELEMDIWKQNGGDRSNFTRSIRQCDAAITR